MVPGFAANAYRASMAAQDAEGNVITETYATKTEVQQKQDKLPYNDQWGVYDVGCWSAVNATRDVNGKDIDTTYAKKKDLEALSAVVGTANTQLEEIA